MTRAEALRRVSDHVAGWVSGADFSEATGLDPADLEDLSPADEERLGWAVATVIDRLYRMGGRE